MVDLRGRGFFRSAVGADTRVLARFDELGRGVVPSDLDRCLRTRCVFIRSNLASALTAVFAVVAVNCDKPNTLLANVNVQTVDSQCTPYGDASQIVSGKAHRTAPLRLIFVYTVREFSIR